MTDWVEPSPGTAESYQTSGAIRYAAATAAAADAGWVADTNTDYFAAEAGATGTPLNAFAESHSGTSMDVTIDTGEACISGKWLARDTTTTVTLAASTLNQTVYAGWPASTGDSVIVGLEGDFPTNHGKTPIWTFDTDGSGVTAATDERQIGPQQPLRIENRSDRPAGASEGRLIYRTDKS